jgi:DGQHR domain-containing protein
MRTKKLTALKVQQWMSDWDKVEFDPKELRRKPDPHFYLFTISAADLRALSGIYRRSTEGGLLRSSDLSIQRRHDEERSRRIGEFIKYGYPWSELNAQKRASGEFDDLRKPGWLPTAIVVNILRKDDKRRGKPVYEGALITVTDSTNGAAVIELPSSFSGSDWKIDEGEVPPIEVIDGQHRLWAFGERLKTDFELPVVAFHGLDISWQAYLFWSINITPKRINASLAFDLYPLLRTEDWLERFEGHSVYRETRSQELVESLWSHPASPWFHHINMLGETGLPQKMVSQAAWVRSLMASYVKSYEGKRVSIGGLFGSRMGESKDVLGWSRAQQAAFLILMGQKFEAALKKYKGEWAQSLRTGKSNLKEKDSDPAFIGPHTLLNTDQGIRALLHVTNDLCFIQARELQLYEWNIEQDAGAVDEGAVTMAIKSLEAQPVEGFLEKIASELISYDWRTSTAPDLSEPQRREKLVFRGSGGYKELRSQVLRHLVQLQKSASECAAELLEILGYTK